MNFHILHHTADMGTRDILFNNEIYIDSEDFREVPPKKYKRLIPGGEVRLRNAYVIKCDEVIKKPGSDEVIELRCSVDMDTLGKKPEGRKVKGVIHWVSASHSIPAEIRLYDRLFSDANPTSTENMLESLNPNSLTVVTNARVEQGLGNSKPGDRFQFEREGYYCIDEHDSKTDNLVFNRTVTLRDTWAKLEKQSG